MKIIAHRGFWVSESEKNSKIAFDRAFDQNLGIETDVRQYNNHLIISHGPVCDLKLTLKIALSSWNGSQLLALNVKEDGLAISIKELMAAYSQENWFVFDMSIPDARDQLKAGNPIFVRMSEFEREPAWLNHAKGVWLDNFESIWFGIDTLLAILEQNKKVCIVSPELHGRDYQPLWDMIKPLAKDNNLILCTDFPGKALSFFGEIA